MNDKNSLSHIGEFCVIHRLEKLVSGRAPHVPPGSELLVGIGDDAAAWRSGGGITLSKTDTMVEGIHFTRKTATWRDVGWKAMVANQSDLAAMGGEPTYALITLGLPPDLGVAPLEELYTGLLDACEAHGGQIVGGDIVRSSVFFVTISLNGTAQGPLLLRSAAQVGDQVAATGTLGGAAGGLRMLLHGLSFNAAKTRALRNAHLHRTPRLAEGKALVAAGVRCALDISDGLVDDLGKLCAASGIAARIDADALPLHPALREAFPNEAQQMALSSGEEYELLFTAPPKVMGKVLPKLASGATVIGEIVTGTAGHVTVVDSRGQPVTPARTGWDHFRS